MLEAAILRISQKLCLFSENVKNKSIARYALYILIADIITFGIRLHFYF